MVTKYWKWFVRKFSHTARQSYYAELIQQWRTLADKATASPWQVWGGPEYCGGGADLCIGSGKDWIINMDHRYGDDYEERVEHGGECGAPDCPICSIDSAITKEQRSNAEFIAASRQIIPQACDIIEKLIKEIEDIKQGKL